MDRSLLCKICETVMNMKRKK